VCNTFFFRTVASIVNEGKSLPQYNVQLWKKAQKFPLKIQDKPSRIREKKIDFNIRGSLMND